MARFEKELGILYYNIDTDGKTFVDYIHFFRLPKLTIQRMAVSRVGFYTTSRDHPNGSNYSGLYTRIRVVHSAIRTRYVPIGTLNVDSAG